MNRNLGNINPQTAKASGWVVDAGDPGIWECVCKAHNDDADIMKSTKRMKVPGGWLYQVTTESPLGIAEALAFVPEG
ncbi:MAG: hypothetical protein WC749_09620 [Dehalococcoidia bacterium]